MSELTEYRPVDAAVEGIRGSLPVGLRERVSYVSRLTQGESISGPDAIGVPIAVKEWVIHPTESVDEHTGEVLYLRRLVLSDGAGVQISTSSGVAVQAWLLVVSMLGTGPYDPPVTVVLRRGRGRSGREYTSLVVME